MGLAFDISWIALLTIVFLSTGIASIVVYSTDLNTHVDCGVNGSPQLSQWVFGTGIAYTVIGTMYSITIIAILLHEFYKKRIHVLNMYVWQAFTNLAALFSIPWTCVGVYSCISKGLDCASLNSNIWIVSIVTILLFIAFMPFAITFHVTVLHARELKRQADDLESQLQLGKKSNTLRV